MTFGDLPVHLDLLTIKEALLYVIIGYRALEKIGFIMDLSSQIVVLTHNNKKVSVVLEHEKCSPFVHQNSSDSELFTKESSSDARGDPEDADLNTDEKIVVALAKELLERPDASPSESSDGDEDLDRAAVLYWKLNHLRLDIVQQQNDMMRDMGILYWSFRVVQATNVPVQHDSELTDKTPIYHNPFRMSPATMLSYERR